MDFLKNPIFSYIGLGVAVIALALSVIKPEWSSFLWTFAGVLGYTSVEVVRLNIDSNGWKTHAIVVVIVLVFGAQLFGFIDPVTAQALMAAFAPITGITMQQALAKSPTSSVPRVKALKG